MDGSKKQYVSQPRVSIDGKENSSELRAGSCLRGEALQCHSETQSRASAAEIC